MVVRADQRAGRSSAGSVRHDVVVTEGDRIRVRGAYESRAALGILVVLLMGMALLGLAGSGTSTDARVSAIVFLVPAVGVCVVLLVGILRSSVVVDPSCVEIRPFLGRRREIARDAITGVRIVDSGTWLIPAAAPALELADGTEVTLMPLLAWTWWRPASPRRVIRAVDRLRRALALDGPDVDR